MTDVLTVDELTAQVIEWLGDLEGWPPVSVDEAIRINHALKTDGPRYYGVQAFLVSLIHFGNKWPPFTPTEIAEQLLDSPKFSKMLAKYASSIAVIDYRIDKGNP